MIQREGTCSNILMTVKNRRVLCVIDNNFFLVLRVEGKSQIRTKLLLKKKKKKKEIPR